jgi:hypothetical protein
MAKNNVFEREYKLTIALKFLQSIKTAKGFTRLFGKDMEAALREEVIPAVKRKLRETQKEARKVIVQTAVRRAKNREAMKGQVAEVLDFDFKVWYDQRGK